MCVQEVSWPIFQNTHLPHEAWKEIHVSTQVGHFTFTIIRLSGQEIEKLPRDRDIFTIRKTSRGEKSARIHERYSKVQNCMRGHSLSFDPPSSAKNVDGVEPAIMSRGSP